MGLIRGKLNILVTIKPILRLRKSVENPGKGLDNFRYL